MFGVAVAATLSVPNCTAGVAIAAICSNSASNFDMYEKQSSSEPSPQGLSTLFDASHHQPRGIYLHRSPVSGFEMGKDFIIQEIKQLNVLMKGC